MHHKMYYQLMCLLCVMWCVNILNAASSLAQPSAMSSARPPYCSHAKQSLVG